MTVGEAGGTSPKQAMDYIDQDRENKEIQAVFNTDHLDLYGESASCADRQQLAEPLRPGPFDDGDEPERKLSGPKRILTMWQQHMHEAGGWNSVTGGSHDQPRSLTRFGTEDPALRVQAAKALAVLWLSLAGTPYVYQGDELGMINLPWEWDISEYKDLVTQGHYAKWVLLRVALGLALTSRPATQAPRRAEATGGEPGHERCHGRSATKSTGQCQESFPRK